MTDNSNKFHTMTIMIVLWNVKNNFYKVMTDGDKGHLFVNIQSVYWM